MTHVRAAAVDDADAIGEIHVLAWRAAYAGIVPAAFLRDLSITDRQQTRRQQLADPNRSASVFVAEHDGTVTGFAAAGPSRDPDSAADTGELYAIYLHPVHWRTGTGTLLLRHAVDTLSSTGWRTATLWVLADNTGARRFYERAGWTTDGAAKFATIGDSPPLQQVRYRRTLNR